MMPPYAALYSPGGVYTHPAIPIGPHPHGQGVPSSPAALELATLVPLQLLKSSETKCIMFGRQKEKTLKKMGLGVSALPFTFVAHLLAVAAIVMVLFWNIHFRGGLAWEATNKNLIFNIHPVLMLIGLIIMGGEAIITYKALPLKKEIKKLIHLILHAIALVLGIVGICAAFKNHNESGIANMYSLHSWLGIGVISLYGIQWIFGFVMFFYPGGSESLRSQSIPWHVLFGLIVYVLALGTASLGFLEKLTFLESSAGVAKYGSEALLVNFTAIVTILFGTFVVLSSISSAPGEDDYSPI